MGLKWLRCHRSDPCRVMTLCIQRHVTLSLAVSGRELLLIPTQEREEKRSSGEFVCSVEFLLLFLPKQKQNNKKLISVHLTRSERGSQPDRHVDTDTSVPSPRRSHAELEELKVGQRAQTTTTTAAKRSFQIWCQKTPCAKRRRSGTERGIGPDKDQFLPLLFY